MDPVSAVERDAQERAIEALARDVERRFSERLERNARETSKALLADACGLKSPTAIRSFREVMEMTGIGGPRRRWRKERRADEERLDALWRRLDPGNTPPP